MKSDHDIITICLRTEYGPKVLEYISNAWFINISAREELDKYLLSIYE